MKASFPAIALNPDPAALSQPHVSRQVLYSVGLPEHRQLPTHASRRISGAGERIRTPDLLITNQLLYP